MREVNLPVQSVIGRACVLLLVCGFFCSCGQNPSPADLVLLGGKIVTVDAALPEAEALAVAAGRITAIGNNDDVERYIGEATRVVDLEGRLAIPGFIDAHAHLSGLGYAKMKLDLTAAANWDEIVEMVKNAVDSTQPGEWILGRGWHQEKWDRLPSPNIDGLPTHGEISSISPDNPVYLTHASGHSAIANARAMKAADITNATAAPEGGDIVCDDEDNPIGVFRETAMDLLDTAYNAYIADRTPEEEEAVKRQAVELAMKECLTHGVTGFHDAGATFATIDLFKKMAVEGNLDIRLYVMISESNDSLMLKLPDYKIIGLGDDRLTVRAIKRVIDGALGSHGAWLLEPYDDLPASTGLNTEPVDSMQVTARLAREHGFQLCTHAIGDRANRETLDIYEQALTAAPDKTDHRWRIEHAQHIDPADIPRFGRLGVIASMQGIHCTSDGPWVPKRLGDRRSEEGAYVWQKLLTSGAVIPNGTDAPVERIDPIANFYALVTRKMADGRAFYPEQRMTREQALRAYTLDGAYAAFEEDIKGSLSVGKLADITVLSKDIMIVPEDEIRDAEVVYTIVGGKIMYAGE